MREAYGDRLEAAEEIERLRAAVAGERAAILELIESERINGHLYDAASAWQGVAHRGTGGRVRQCFGLQHATARAAIAK
jgi:hypothetical protein